MANTEGAVTSLAHKGDDRNAANNGLATYAKSDSTDTSGRVRWMVRASIADDEQQMKDKLLREPIKQAYSKRVNDATRRNIHRMSRLAEREKAGRIDELKVLRQRAMEAGDKPGLHSRNKSTKLSTEDIARLKRARDLNGLHGAARAAFLRKEDWELRNTFTITGIRPGVSHRIRVTEKTQAAIIKGLVRARLVHLHKKEETGLPGDVLAATEPGDARTLGCILRCLPPGVTDFAAHGYAYRASDKAVWPVLDGVTLRPCRTRGVDGFWTRSRLSYAAVVAREGLGREQKVSSPLPVLAISDLAAWTPDKRRLVSEWNRYADELAANVPAAAGHAEALQRTQNARMHSGNGNRPAQETSTRIVPGGREYTLPGDLTAFDRRPMRLGVSFLTLLGIWAAYRMFANPVGEEQGGWNATGHSAAEAREHNRRMHSQNGNVAFVQAAMLPMFFDMAHGNISVSYSSPDYSVRTITGQEGPGTADLYSLLGFSLDTAYTPGEQVRFPGLRLNPGSITNLQIGTHRTITVRVSVGKRGVIDFTEKVLLERSFAVPRQSGLTSFTLDIPPIECGPIQFTYQNTGGDIYTLKMMVMMSGDSGASGGGNWELHGLSLQALAGFGGVDWSYWQPFTQVAGVSSTTINQPGNDHTPIICSGQVGVSGPVTVQGFDGMEPVVVDTGGGEGMTVSIVNGAGVSWPMWVSNSSSGDNIPAATGDDAARAANWNATMHALNGNGLLSAEMLARRRDGVSMVRAIESVLADRNIGRAGNRWLVQFAKLVLAQPELQAAVDMGLNQFAVLDTYDVVSPAPEVTVADATAVEKLGLEKPKKPSSSSGGSGDGMKKDKQKDASHEHRVAAVTRVIKNLLGTGPTPTWDVLESYLIVRQPSRRFISALLRQMRTFHIDAYDCLAQAVMQGYLGIGPAASVARLMGDLLAAGSGAEWRDARVMYAELRACGFGTDVMTLSDGTEHDLSAVQDSDAIALAALERAGVTPPGGVQSTTDDNGAKAAFAARHNRDMHALNGNIVRACDADRHNREMHSLNGNTSMAGVGGGLGAKSVSPATPAHGAGVGGPFMKGLPQPVNTEAIEAASDIEDLLKTTEPSEYRNSVGMAKRLALLYGASVPANVRLQGGRTYAARTITRTTATGAIDRTGLYAPPVSPLIPRSFTRATTIVPAGARIRYNGTVPRWSVGVTTGGDVEFEATSFGLELDNMSKELGKTLPRANLPAQGSDFLLNDLLQFLRCADPTQARYSGFEHIALVACLFYEQFKRSSIANTQITPDVFYTALAGFVDPGPLPMAPVVNRQNLVPVTEEYNQTTDMGTAFKCTSVIVNDPPNLVAPFVGSGPAVVLHYDYASALAAQSMLDGPIYFLPEMLYSCLGSGPSARGRAIGLIAGILGGNFPFIPISRELTTTGGHKVVYTETCNFWRVLGAQNIHFVLPSAPSVPVAVAANPAAAANYVGAIPTCGPCPMDSGVYTIDTAGGCAAYAGGNFVARGPMPVNTSAAWLGAPARPAFAAMSIAGILQTFEHGNEPTTLAHIAAVERALSRRLPLLGPMGFMKEAIDVQSHLFRALRRPAGPTPAFLSFNTNPDAPVGPDPGVVNFGRPVNVTGRAVYLRDADTDANYYDGVALFVGRTNHVVNALTLAGLRNVSQMGEGRWTRAGPGEPLPHNMQPGDAFDGVIGAATALSYAAMYDATHETVGVSGYNHFAAVVNPTLISNDAVTADLLLNFDGMHVMTGTTAVITTSQMQQGMQRIFGALTGGKMPRDLNNRCMSERLIYTARPGTTAEDMFPVPSLIPQTLSTAGKLLVCGSLIKDMAPPPVYSPLAPAVYMKFGTDQIGLSVTPVIRALEGTNVIGHPVPTEVVLEAGGPQPPGGAPWYDSPTLYNRNLWMMDCQNRIADAQFDLEIGSTAGIVAAAVDRALYSGGDYWVEGVPTIVDEALSLHPRFDQGRQVMMVCRSPSGLPLPNDTSILTDVANRVGKAFPTILYTPVAALVTQVSAIGPARQSLWAKHIKSSSEISATDQVLTVQTPEQAAEANTGGKPVPGLGAILAAESGGAVTHSIAEGGSFASAGPAVPNGL